MLVLMSLGGRAGGKKRENVRKEGRVLRIGGKKGR